MYCSAIVTIMNLSQVFVISFPRKLQHILKSGKTYHQNVLSFIETANKLSLKQNFRTFRHKKTTGVGDSDFKGKEENQSFNFRYFGHVWDTPIMDGVANPPPTPPSLTLSFGA